MSAPAVLVIANERDVGADFLIRELVSRRIRVVRLNAERAPDWSLTISPSGGWTARRGERRITSQECVGVWWRRPEVPFLEGEAAEAIADQWRALLSALAHPAGPVWVSDPQSIRRAEDKMLQLRQAHVAGLRVPNTIWTNGIVEARSFVDRCGGRAVAKSVASAWWEAGSQGRFVFASLVGSDDLPTARRLGGAPVCFQQPIWPKRDIRVTVVGEAVLSAIRHTTAEEPLDWRLAADGPWAPYELPDDAARACADLVGGLGLRFGGVDLARDESGEHWFLELNPNGEWGWLQRAGLPIAEALADVLLS